MQKSQRHYSVKPVTMILGPSFLLACLFAAMGGMAVCAIMLLPWAWLWQCMMVAGVIAMVAWHVWRDAWRRYTESLVLIELDHEGKLWVTMRNGLRHAAQVQGSSLVTAGLTVLNLKFEQGRASCLILPDAVEAEPFRRLRVWLRWGSHALVEEI